MTTPGFCLGSTLLVVFPSLRPILLSSFWAANALGWPLRLGTVVCLGSSITTTTASAATSGTAMRGGTGPSAPTGVAVSCN